MNKGRIVSTAAFLLYIAAIAVLCLIHNDSLPDISKTWFGIPSDKVAHFVMFSPFIPLAYLSFRPKQKGLVKRLILTIILVLIGTGMAYITEWLQGQTNYRTFEVSDIQADILGIGFGTVLTLIFIIIRHTIYKKNQ